MTAKMIRVYGLVALALIGRQAAAGVYTDDLSKCIVKSASTSDQELLVQWMFSMLSLNPAVTPLSTVTSAQRDDYNKKMADLTVRLVAVSCAKEATDAIKYEGGLALQQSFQVLGQVAARSLMSGPGVATGMQSLGKYFAADDRLKVLMKNAGLPEEPTPAAPPAK